MEFVFVLGALPIVAVDALGLFSRLSQGATVRQKAPSASQFARSIECAGRPNHQQPPAAETETAEEAAGLRYPRLHQGGNIKGVWPIRRG